MKVPRKIIAASAGAATLALGGAAWAIAAGGDDGPSATGPGADRARAAALDRLGGGRANAVERGGDEGAAWEVEVTTPAGKTFDVRLDARYHVVAVERDGEETGGPND